MSHIASYWAIEQKGLPVNAKIVLMLLADCHNGHTGECFPSINLLVEKSNISERSVHYALDHLCSAGLVTKVFRQDTYHRQRSNQYMLNIAITVGEGATGAPGRVQEVHPFNLEYNNQDTVPLELQNPLEPFSSNYEEPPVDELAEFWNLSKVIFEGWRIPPKRANPLIGKLLKLSGGDHKEVGRLLEEAMENGIDDPVPWLIACVSGKKKNAKSAKKQEIAEAFAELEAQSERRKAQWREQYGTEYGIYPDAGGDGAKGDGLLQPEPHSEHEVVHSERGEGVGEVPTRRVAQVVRPIRRNINESPFRTNHSGIGGGSGENDEAWQ